MTIFLAILNYRGIRLSATFQNWTASTVILLFLFLLAISAWRGSPANFQPLFRASPFVSIVLTLQIVPYFLTGFESAPKCAEEANPEFNGRGYMRGLAAATIAGLLLGDALLIPVTEVGSMASAFGWLATCVSFFLIERNLRSRALTLLGILVAALLLIMKLVPAFPGHFTRSEWLALALWLVLGASLHLRSSSSSRTSAKSAPWR